MKIPYRRYIGVFIGGVVGAFIAHSTTPEIKASISGAAATLIALVILQLGDKK